MLGGQPALPGGGDAGVADHAVRVEVAGDPGEGVRSGVAQQLEILLGAAE